MWNHIYLHAKKQEVKWRWCTLEQPTNGKPNWCCRTWCTEQTKLTIEMFFILCTVCFVLHYFTNKSAIKSILSYNLIYNVYRITLVHWWERLIQACFCGFTKVRGLVGKMEQDKEVTGQIWCAWVLMCVCAFEEEKRETRRREKGKERCDIIN